MANLDDILIDDGNCFACGLNNPIGLKLKFNIQPDSGVAVSKVTVKDHFNGWKGAVHGGIITTLLDETMVYACTSTGVFTVTGTIEVKFHRPVPIEVELTVTGEVVENRGRSITTSGTIQVDGRILASAKGIMIPVREDHKAMDSISERLVK